MTLATRNRALSELEKVVKDGLSNFVKVGEALMEIHDRRLYIQRGHDTFEDYCREEFGISRQYGRNMIDAARVVHALPQDAIAAPKNEAQARELAPLLDDPVQMANVWEQVRAEGNVTAEKVRSFVKRVLPPTEVRPSIGNTRESREPGDRPYTAPPEHVTGILDDYRDKLARSRRNVEAVAHQEHIDTYSYHRGQIAVWEKVIGDLESLR